MTSVSFLSKLKNTLSGNIFLVKGTDDNIKCWYYVDVLPLKSSIFQRNIENGVRVDLLDYGKILVSGWGEEPHEHAQKQIEALGANYNPANDAEWQKIIDEKTNIYFVQAKDNDGLDFHAYVAVNGLMADQFIKDALKGDINVNNYGRVVKIEWGFPSDETKKEMTEKYGVDHEYIDNLLASA